MPRYKSGPDQHKCLLHYSWTISLDFPSFRFGFNYVRNEMSGCDGPHIVFAETEHAPNKLEVWHRLLYTIVRRINLDTDYYKHTLGELSEQKEPKRIQSGVGTQELLVVSWCTEPTCHLLWQIILMFKMWLPAWPSVTVTVMNLPVIMTLEWTALFILHHVLINPENLPSDKLWLTRPCN